MINVVIYSCAYLVQVRDKRLGGKRLDGRTHVHPIGSLNCLGSLQYR